MLRSLLFSLLLLESSLAATDTMQGPVFLQEPPHRADFSNSTGVALQCSAHGNPPPAITWLLADGSEAHDVPGLRRLLGNGTLLLMPFSAEEYKPEVHSAAYRCVATNSWGSIVSRRVQVRAAVVKQFYEVQVYDEFVILGNTAVLRCHVPSFVREYVIVTSWVRGARDRIVTDVESGGRYSVFPSGELHIRHVTHADGALAYRCETRHLLTGEQRLSAVSGRLLVTAPQSSVPPRITDSRSHIQARFKQPAELPCAAQGYPLPSYSWYRSHGGQSAPVRLDDRVQQVGGSLFLRSSLLEDSGRYMCIVNNSVGAERASTSLLITTPLSAYMSPQLQTVDVGRAALLNCTTEGHPQLAVAWFKDARPLQTSTRVRLLASQTLRIDHVERTDKGMYQCIVSNNDETAQGTAQLKLGDAAPVLLTTFSSTTLRPGVPWTAQCEASGSPLPTVSWTLDGVALQSSTGDDRHISVAVAAAGGSVTGRVNIASLKAEDGGIYECIAANAVGTARHSSPLHVLGPPHVRPMQDRRVVAAKDAAFHCRVAGFPISEIRWEREGKSLPENHRQQVFPNGTLVIKDIQKYADEGGYVCLATNPDGQTARSKLNVQVMEAPEIDPIAVKPDLQRGMRMHLTCVVSKGDFPIVIRWLKDGSPIPHGQGVTEKTLDEYSSILTFSGLSLKHTGNYTCQASNAAATKSYSVEVIVNVPPSWRMEPEDAEIIVGKSITLACAAEGSPSPRIHWKKDTGALPPLYQDLNHIMNNYKVLQNGSLLIHNIRSEDKGYYLCQATNGIGVGLSKVVYLTVHVPARFPAPFQNVTVSKGSVAMLDCVAQGDKPVSINWYRDGHQFDPKLHSRATLKEESLDTGVSSRLTFRHIHRDDTSTFLCVATNQYGSDRSELQLIVQEAPEAPLNVHVNNYSSRSVNLSWEQPYDGNSVITAFVIQYKNSSVPWHRNVPQLMVDGDQVNAYISDLMPAHVYHIRVLAENSVGTSNASDVVTVTTLEEVPEAPPRDVKAKGKNSETLIVSWKPPEDHLQHGEIMGYYIGFRVSNSSEPFHYKTFEVIPGMELQNTLSGLRKFTEYSILVQAYNRAGAGPRSPEVTASTDEDVPGAPPIDVQCTAISSQNILVLWSSPPLSEINGILKGYKVLYRGLSDWDDLSPPSEEITRTHKLELTNLERFCNYSIEVRAFTSKGDGVTSRPIFCRTQEDVPGEPNDIKALVMDSKTVLLSWKPPRHPNGRIKKYKVYMRSLDGIGLDKDHFDIPAEQTYYTISHLQLYHRYEFWVTAFTIIGEGSASRRVVQAPANHVPAKIASFSQHITTALREDLRLPCHAVGQPIPQRNWKKNGITIREDSHLQINTEWVLLISPVQSGDAGNYSCSVENVFGKDEIEYFVTVQVPLAPTELYASATAISSIYLTWQLSPAVGSIVQGYYLHFKREFGEWEKIKLPSDDSTFSLNNLQCGTKYHFYMQAFNQLGQSSPTPTISMRTQGSAPIAPNNSDLIRVNSTSISLNLTSWNDGGCPITSIVVEYKLKKEPSWTLVSNNVKIEQNEFLVLDLNPETWYTLRVTAHNSAGSTIATYDFITLTHSGATIAPDLIIHSGYGDKHFYSEIGIIIPIIAGVLILIVAVIGVFIYLKRKQELFSSNKFCEKPSEMGLVNELEKKVSTARGENCDGSLAPLSPREPVYLPTPMRVSLGRRQDISPYATFRVPMQGSGECSELGDDSDLQQHQYNEKYTSSAESTYSKIHKKPQYENEGADWIPLHNLYQAHRY